MSQLLKLLRKKKKKKKKRGGFVYGQVYSTSYLKNELIKKKTKKQHKEIWQRPLKERITDVALKWIIFNLYFFNFLYLKRQSSDFLVIILRPFKYLSSSTPLGLSAFWKSERSTETLKPAFRSSSHLHHRVWNRLHPLHLSEICLFCFFLCVQSISRSLCLSPASNLHQLLPSFKWVRFLFWYLPVCVIFVAMFHLYFVQLSLYVLFDLRYVEASLVYLILFFPIRLGARCNVSV